MMNQQPYDEPTAETTSATALAAVSKDDWRQAVISLSRGKEGIEYGQHRFATLDKWICELRHTSGAKCNTSSLCTTVDFDKKTGVFNVDGNMEEKSLLICEKTGNYLFKHGDCEFRLRTIWNCGRRHQNGIKCQTVCKVFDRKGENCFITFKEKQQKTATTPMDVD